MQSELLENGRKPKRYEAVPGKSYETQHQPLCFFLLLSPALFVMNMMTVYDKPYQILLKFFSIWCV